MTQEQYDLLLAKMNAIAKAIAKLVGTGFDNPLVGGTTDAPIAPTVPEIAADPGKYSGTRWDPLNPEERISSTNLIANFESLEYAGEFPGGTVGEWYRKDKAAAKRYVEHRFPGFQWGKLADAQKRFLGI